MRIDEVTNPLGAIGALAGGVVKQLGHQTFRKATGKDLDDILDKTQDLYSFLIKQPELLRTPRVQQLIKQGVVTPEQEQQILALLMQRQKQPGKPQSGQPAQPTQPAGPADSPDIGIENIPTGYRLRVQNPQKTATYYKHSDGKWYNEFNQPIQQKDWATLDTYADAGGVMEKNPPAGMTGFRSGQSRRRQRGSSGA